MTDFLNKNATFLIILIILVALVIITLTIVIVLLIIPKLKKINKKENIKKQANDFAVFQKKTTTSLESKPLLTQSLPTQSFNNQTSLTEDLDAVKELKNNLHNQIEKTKQREIELAHCKKTYETQVSDLKKTLELENIKLSKIAQLSVEDAKSLLIENVYQDMRGTLNRFYHDEKAKLMENLEIETQKILVSAMENMAEEIVSQRSTATIALENDAWKGRIIGKQGRNKRLFEALTGVDMIIEKQAEISLSCANPIRREIAVNLLNVLIQSKNIEPIKIETLYLIEKENFEKKIYQYGKEALEDKLKIFNLPKEIYPIVGRLRFRHSYGQNVLQHCLECAALATHIALQIKIDPEKAKLAAFFHDIGKSVDFEEDYDHVESGVQIAKQHQLPKYIINAIESHHHKVEPTTIYGALVKVVDTLSAARPGARIDSFSEYIKRVQKLEEICKKIDGVNEAYALQSGRIVRIMVKPDLIKDEQLDLLSYEIQKAIEADQTVNKFQIRIIIIREKRIEVFANQRSKIPFVLNRSHHYHEQKTLTNES